MGGILCLYLLPLLLVRALPPCCFICFVLSSYVASSTSAHFTLHGPSSTSSGPASSLLDVWLRYVFTILNFNSPLHDHQLSGNNGVHHSGHRAHSGTRWQQSANPAEHGVSPPPAPAWRNVISVISAVEKQSTHCGQPAASRSARTPSLARLPMRIRRKEVGRRFRGWAANGSGTATSRRQTHLLCLDRRVPHAMRG